MADELKGAAEMLANLRFLTDAVRPAQEAALYEFAEIEMTEMKKRTPVDTGALQASGHVDPPEWKSGTLTIVLGFGGAAIEYAVYVHEDLEAFHKIGQAKFVESVLLESEPFFESRVGESFAANMRRKVPWT